MRPENTPRLRADLARWLASRNGMHWFASRAPMLAQGLGERSQVVEIDRLRQGIARGMRAAELYHVTSDMCTVTSVASQTLPREEILADDLIKPAGFVTLGEPFYTQSDVHGDPVEALLWFTTPFNLYSADGHPTGRTAPGVVVVGFNDPRPRWRNEGRAIDPLAGPTLPSVLLRNPFDDVARFDIDLSTQENLRQFTRTFWTLAEQPDVARIRTLPARRRRGSRDVPPTECGPVRIVSLVNRAGSGASSISERDWRHRWVVRGHWRRQWYPTESRHKQKWIMPYLKGPDGAPLLPRRESVKVLSR